MMLLDTDVAVDVLRNHPPAVAWLQGLGATPLGLPGLVVMELLQGCQNKTEQQRIEQFCRPFALSWPTAPDCDRALQDFAAFHLSHNLGLLDALLPTPPSDLPCRSPRSTSSITESSPV